MVNSRLFPSVENIHRLMLPAPEGHPYLRSVNMYVVGPGPITLIDAGMRSPKSFGALERQLHKLGFAWIDVERIILTHCHGDHIGLVTEIIDAAGHPVDCFIHAEDKWRIAKEECGGRIWDWDEDVERFFSFVDMPQEEIVLLRRHFDQLEKMAEPIENLSLMEDGRVFECNGCRLQVVHTPGHSPGACCLYDPDQKVLFSGDTIIDHIPPKAIMELKRHRLRNPNYLSLREHLSSLNKLAAMDIRYVFPGHGGVGDNLSELISSYDEHHKQMMTAILDALGNWSMSIYDIVKKLFRKKTSGNLYFAVSEITVHLEYLVAEERVRLINDGPPALYQACEI
jgi:glyoxylase-like metal-dependent hydrolase (beta-lactamase superfamily II)